MAININPESAVVTGNTGSSWYDHVQAWHDWINNTSNKWEITDFTDDESGASGDKGFITKPTTGSLSFEMRIYAHSSSNRNPGVRMTASLDPGANISTVASATTKPSQSPWPSTASQDPVGIFEETRNYHSGSLISATDESLTIMIREPAGTTPDKTTAMFHGGDIMTPVFSNDPEKGLTGLGYLAGLTASFSANNNNQFMNTADPDYSFYIYENRSRMVVSSSTDFASITSFGDIREQNIRNNSHNKNGGRITPLPIPVSYVSSDGQYGKLAGTLKYMYVWDDQQHAMDKLESANNNDSFIFVRQDNDEKAEILFPWDKNTDPKA